MNGSETKDKDICDYADKNDNIVITKDYDFKNTFLVHNTPKKLIKVNLGNLSNEELILRFNSLLNELPRLSNENLFLIELEKYDFNVSTNS